MNRRDFLKVFGFGGAAATVGGATEKSLAGALDGIVFPKSVSDIRHPGRFDPASAPESFFDSRVDYGQPGQFGSAGDLPAGQFTPYEAGQEPLVAGVKPPVNGQPPLSRPAIIQPARLITIYNTHNDEKFVIDPREVGKPGWDKAGWNRFMRDVRTGQSINMHDALAPRFARVAEAVQATSCELISGYRSPETNEELRSKGGAVAFKSRHTIGQAMDWRAPGVALESVRDSALRIARAEGFGGVGYYPGSDNNFVHTDVGPQRYWELPQSKKTSQAGPRPRR